MAGLPLLTDNHDGRGLSRPGPATNRLYLRRLDRNELIPFAGTDRATNPFFSPDGRWIGFAADGKLMKVPAEGGSPFTLCDLGDSRGASWGSNGRIVFGPGPIDGLWSVGEAGGEPVPLTTTDSSKSERSHRWPHVLPGGKTALFTVGSTTSPDYYEDAVIDAVDLETGARKTLIRGASSAQYVASGHLLYSRSGVLFAVPLDPDRLEMTGNATPVVQDAAGDPTTAIRASSRCSASDCAFSTALRKSTNIGSLWRAARSSQL